MARHVVRAWVSLCLLLPCARGMAADAGSYVEFPGSRLGFGREVWLGTCENCHAWGVADAPIPMKPEDWRPRVAKSRATLYDHAINGYFGPDDSYMPERGGNASLSDDAVKAAVDYMLELAKFYIDKSD